MTLDALSGWWEGLLEAVWLVDPLSLRIVGVNTAACALTGLARDALVGLPAIELTATPEDMFFWEDVAAGLADSIHSHTLLRSADGDAVPVERKVSRVVLDEQAPVYLVALKDLRAASAAADELEDRMAEIRATLESSADGILVLDLGGRVRHVNHVFTQLWSLDVPALEATGFAGLWPAMEAQVQHPDAFHTMWTSAAASQHGAPDEPPPGMVTLRSGRVLEHRTVPQISRHRVCGRVHTFRDITRHLADQAALRLAAKVFESSPDAVFITDAAFRVVQVNPRFHTLTGWGSGGALDPLHGQTAADLFYDPQRPELFADIEIALVAQGHWSGEVWCKLGVIPMAVEVSWVALQDAQGRIAHTVGHFSDMTARLEAQSHIERLAFRDVLTGLPNRTLLGQRVEFALRLAERNHGRFAIMFLDLDRFKNINDSLGHSFGDRVLMEVAQRIGNGMRDVDTLCRLGGDEFVAFVQDADAAGAEIAARRILTGLAQPYALDNIPLVLGCSIGIALYPDDGRTLDDLIKCADTAMYRVKERGRGNFRFYQPQMNVDLLSRMRMDHAMRRALEQGLFRLHYQPQVALSDGRMVGAEALLRWTDPALGMVSPAEFIPLAEETGLIVPIGRWVMETAVAQAVRWQQMGLRLCVSVNVSALQFQQVDFVEQVAQCLAAAALDADLLELELTESILVHDANEALPRLFALHQLGVRLAIDDFGTGYSSLSYLKKFPISKLKIDRSFVTGLPEDESDRAIVSATIAMAHALKLTVVAEGVETVAQRDYLHGLSCGAYQGYLYAPGVPPERLTEWAKEQGKGSPFGDAGAAI